MISFASREREVRTERALAGEGRGCEMRPPTRRSTRGETRSTFGARGSGEFCFTRFRRHRSGSFVRSRVGSHGSSRDRSASSGSKPDDPSTDSSNHDSSFREGHPELGRDPSTSRGLAIQPFARPTRLRRRRDALNLRGISSRCETLLPGRLRRASRRRRDVRRRCVRARETRRVGGVCADGSSSADGSRVRRVMDFG